MNLRRAPHGAGSPAAHVLVGPLVDGRLADEERVEILARVLDLGVGNRALDHLAENGGAGLGGELKELKRLGRVFAAHEVRDHPRLAGRDAGMHRTGLGNHRQTSRRSERRYNRPSRGVARVVRPAPRLA